MSYSADPALSPAEEAPARRGRAPDEDPWWDTFPWWAVLLGAIIVWFGYLTFFVDDYNRAWQAISPGITATIRISLWSFAIAVVIGLIAGMGRISRNVVFRTLSRTYIEFIRGVPTLPLLFFMAFVIVLDVADLFGVDNKSIPQEWRGIIALALIYGGYLAEVFRGGIQSIPPGQFEAGRSLGLSYRRTMGHVVLPQALRAILPPLGNDFIAILKDSSLLSLLAVLEVTQRSRLYVNTSFQPRETYLVLTFTYLVMVIALSLLLNVFERYVTRDRVGER